MGGHCAEGQGNFSVVREEAAKQGAKLLSPPLAWGALTVGCAPAKLISFCLPPWAYSFPESPEERRDRCSEAACFPSDCTLQRRNVNPECGQPWAVISGLSPALAQTVLCSGHQDLQREVSQFTLLDRGSQASGRWFHPSSGPLHLSLVLLALC